VKARKRALARVVVSGGLSALLALGLWLALGAGHESKAFSLKEVFHGHHKCAAAPCADGDWEGTWYWLRSPDQERRVVAALYNRYCIRCHAIDGRGVWDIPDVPDFTNAGWQASCSDAAIACIILEGRGAIMPPFRGTLTLEEAHAMARYLRTFVPGTEESRPDFKAPKK
jgi:mono/diheme cytochrome c family protein